MQYSEKYRGVDPRCVWMSAGIINYKLCDRDFQCDECDFNKAIQGVLPHGTVHKTLFKETTKENTDELSPLINHYLYSLFFDCTIYLDRFYHSSYFWFMPESDNLVQVGIDRILLKIIEPIEKIILPEAGKYCRQNRPLVTIVRGKRTLPLYSPLNGEVLEVNERFMGQNTERGREEDTFCCKMQQEGIRERVQQLCGAVPRLQTFSKNLSLVRKYLERSFSQNRPTGMGITLADGGRIQNCLEKVLGEKAFQELLDELFPAKNGNRIH